MARKQPIAPLLVSRHDTAALLNVHSSKLARLESSGALEPVRYDQNSPSSYVFYRIADVAKIARCKPEDLVRALQAAKPEKPKRITRKRLSAKRGG
jgi:hypothetical protein